jgi:hypothetical protein
MITRVITRRGSVILIAVGLLVLLLAVTSCTIGGFTFGATPTPTATPTPIPISDEDFSQLASGICETFKSDIAQANETADEVQERLGLIADACRGAGEKMYEIDLIEAYAPNAVLLRTSLSARGDLLEAYALQLTEAIKKLEVAAGTSFSLFLLEDGTVIAVIFGEDKIETLDIDSELIMSTGSNFDEITLAAEALGLEDCIP